MGKHRIRRRRNEIARIVTCADKHQREIPDFGGCKGHALMTGDISAACDLVVTLCHGEGAEPTLAEGHEQRISLPSESQRGGGEPDRLSDAHDDRHRAVALDMKDRRATPVRDDPSCRDPGDGLPTQADIEHLLRRTEFVARPGRVAELLPLTIEAAVDNVLAVPSDPGSVTLGKPSNWERGEEYTHFWLNRMAHDSPRPVQERMSLFWHGHFCSDLSKIDGAELMQQQIDGFRRDGMGNLRTIAKQMSTQVAMIRYLDNNDNRKSSPNQNFGRELLELFLLGVGNYTEADV